MEQTVLFKKIAARGKYQDPQAIPDVVSYICRPDKTPSQIIGGVMIDMNDIAGSMIAISEKFHNNSRIRLHHFILTFPTKEFCRLDQLRQIAEEVCGYLGRCYQIVYALHEDTNNPHIHFVFNAVSYINGTKYHGGKTEYYELIELNKDILRSYGFHLIAVKYNPVPYEPHE